MIILFWYFRICHLCGLVFCLCERWKVLSWFKFIKKYNKNYKESLVFPLNKYVIVILYQYGCERLFIFKYYETFLF